MFSLDCVDTKIMCSTLGGTIEKMHNALNRKRKELIFSKWTLSKQIIQSFAYFVFYVWSRITLAAKNRFSKIFCWKVIGLKMVFFSKSLGINFVFYVCAFMSFFDFVDFYLGTNSPVVTKFSYNVNVKITTLCFKNRRRIGYIFFFYSCISES